MFAQGCCLCGLYVMGTMASLAQNRGYSSSPVLSFSLKWILRSVDLDELETYPLTPTICVGL